MSQEHYDVLMRRRKHLVALRDSEDYKAIMVARFSTLAAEHAGKCMDRKLTPEKRAEHIEAAHMAESLIDYVERDLVRVEAELVSEKKRTK